MTIKSPVDRVESLGICKVACCKLLAAAVSAGFYAMVDTCIRCVWVVTCIHCGLLHASIVCDLRLANPSASVQCHSSPQGWQSHYHRFSRKKQERLNIHEWCMEAGMRLDHLNWWTPACCQHAPLDFLGFLNFSPHGSSGWSAHSLRSHADTYLKSLLHIHYCCMHCSWDWSHCRLSCGAMSR